MPENPNHRKSPDDPIQDELTRRLVQHLAGLEPGTRLPSERTLAEKLGTSRTSLRDRLGRLEATGVIERRTGSGTYVGRLSSNAFGQSLMMSIEASSVDAITMLPVRHAIEREAARLAAGRRDHRANAEMAIALDEMAASDRPEDLQHADIAFHKALMAASGATGLIFFSKVLGEVLWGTIVQVRPYENREQLWQIHNAILACIIAQQPAEAMAAVDAHFDWLAAITAPGVADDQRQDTTRLQE